MRVCFRADASAKIGAGHIMRCIALAGELKIRGAEVFFVSREHSGNLIRLIEETGFAVERLHNPDRAYGAAPQEVGHATCLGVPWQEDAAETGALLEKANPDWLIVDSYSIDRRWESEVRQHTGHIMVIDDLADRPHDCDLLLDQNLYRVMETRYDNLVSDSCMRLLGPEYALLRGQFADARKNLLRRDGHVQRILVSYGGADPGNETLKTLTAISHLDKTGLTVDVIVGAQNRHRQELETITSSLPWVSTHFEAQNVAELMVRADLYVGAAGTTIWEICCLGLPSLVITVAENQVLATSELERLGVLNYLGKSGTIRSEQLVEGIRACIRSGEKIKTQSERGLTLVDGYGAARCAETILYFNGDYNG